MMPLFPLYKILRSHFLLFAIFGFCFQALAQQPVITLRGEIYPFSEVYTDTRSDAQFYHVSGSGLQSQLTIVAPEHFLISLDCHNHFSRQISLQAVGSELRETRIFVRHYPGETGLWQGSILHSSEGAANVALAVTGSGIPSAIPLNYYSSATARGSRLKTQLHEVIRNHQVQTYSSLWTHFQITDRHFSGRVWDMYSNNPCGDSPYVFVFGDDQDRGSGGNREGDVYNREHSMPRSWFGGQVDPMHTDLFHIWPVDKWVNARRDNYPYGEVSNPGWVSMNGGKLGNNSLDGYSGIAFEPIDAYKGDIARGFLYMVTRYENLISSWTNSPEGNEMLSHSTYPGYKPWAIQMLLSWHRQDPVSQKEISRNNAIYQIQGNRNPFIDHPELAEYIWGDTTLHYGNYTRESMLFHVFPNPAVSHITITGSEKKAGAVSLLDLNGKILAHYADIMLPLTLQTAWLKPGLYLLALDFGDRPKYFRMAISR